MSAFAKLFMSLVTALFLMGALAACDDNDGTAEQAGEAVDDAVEDAGDAVEDATD
ncbi:MAG: hypothetical protein WD489_10570 [Rhodovibrionaceae bacterium]